MEIPSSRRVIWCTICVWLMFRLCNVHSAPIITDFTPCQNATYPPVVAGLSTPTLYCCPLLPTKPIIDGMPPLVSNVTRVRMAAQCTDEEYGAKVNKAYGIMRSLPDDDPRSFRRQWEIHCAYCGGAFLTYDKDGNPRGIDIHFSWLFLPWHRLYLYFHERILQSLLDDPTFSLSYWNWDSFYSVGNGSSSPNGSCQTQGNRFPTYYADPSMPAYDINRSLEAMNKSGYNFPSFVFSPVVNQEEQPLSNASAQTIIDANINIMYTTLIGAGTNATAFMGVPYRAGNFRGNGTINGGSGTMEQGPHPAVHFWTGTEPPVDIDMGALQTASRDPVFYTHHSNIDRLWEIWKYIGPIVGGDHVDFTDPDFLNAEFLFYDENKDLRRVKLQDSLDLAKLGYTYQDAPIDQWLYVNRTICSTLNYTEVIAAADKLPVAVKDSSGLYELTAGATFNIVIKRPNNTNGLEEFLNIDGIQLDDRYDSGFDVFVDLLNPKSYPNPYKCPEYLGRFVMMANSRAIPGQDTFMWKRSIVKAFVDTNAQVGPSKILISLVSFSSSAPTIYFKKIQIDLSIV